MINEKSFKKINHAIRSEGEHNSRLMFKFPTVLEKKVKDVLDENAIDYKFQKLFYRYMKGYKNYVDAYYIANFWFPKKKLIINIQKDKRKIETDSEGLRTFNYDGVTPKAQVLELKKADVENPEFIQSIVGLLR